MKKSETNKPLISIILPVYNTGKLLCQTMDSILSQTFTSYEIIVVDDGSNEETAKECDKYERKDSRVKVFHKNNGGICKARNFGLQMARGEYFTFCDHDDYFCKTLLETEYTKAKNDNADIVVVGKLITTRDGTNIRGADCLYHGIEIRNNILKILEYGLLDNVWNCLYRYETFFQLRFDESCIHGQEDILFNFEAIKRTRTISSASIPLYEHIVRNDISTSAKIYKDLIPSLIKTNNEVYRLLIYNDFILSKKNANQYVTVQGKYMKTAAVYSIKARVSYGEFKEIIESLIYYPSHGIISKKGTKKLSYIFNSIEMKRTRKLYFGIKIYLWMKKIVRR